jgi:hypothetical protein
MNLKLFSHLIHPEGIGIQEEFHALFVIRHHSLSTGRRCKGKQPKGAVCPFAGTHLRLRPYMAAPGYIG